MPQEKTSVFMSNVLIPSLRRESVVTENNRLMSTILESPGYNWSSSHRETVCLVVPRFSPNASCGSPSPKRICRILYPTVIESFLPCNRITAYHFCAVLVYQTNKEDCHASGDNGSFDFTILPAVLFLFRRLFAGAIVYFYFKKWLPGLDKRAHTRV